MELLRLLADFFRLNMFSHMFYHLCKIGRRAKLDFLDGVFVGSQHSINAGYMRVANVSIQREAVRCCRTSAVALYFSPVAVQIDLLIAIIVL